MGSGDVYKRQVDDDVRQLQLEDEPDQERGDDHRQHQREDDLPEACLLYTSDAADERSSVDLGGRRILKKKKKI